MSFFKLSKKDASILLGNVLDRFDMSLYGFLAPLIAPLFFPSFEPIVQLIMAYSLLATSNVTRPLGAFLFGMLAKRKGPAYALSLSLLGVAVMTFGIGCLPTYGQVGWLSPLSLLLLRMVRGIFASGESTIAKLYILEDKSREKALSASYIYQSSTVLGIILSSGMVTVLTATNQAVDYWRVPFWLGSVVGFVGFYLRKIGKTEIKPHEPFESYEKNNLKLIWKERLSISRVAIIVSFSYLTYAVPFIFMNSFIPLITSISLHEMMKLNTLLLFFDMVAIPFLGSLSQKYPPKNVMLFASLALGVTSMPLFWGLQNASLGYVTFVRIWIVILGLVYMCPLNVWLLRQFEGNGKYLLAGVGSALGSATLGRTTTVASLFLWHTMGAPIAASYYIVGICALTVWALYYSKG